MDTLETLLFGSEETVPLVDLLLVKLSQTTAHAISDVFPALSGVYCIYYDGDSHPLYNGMTGDVPLYVGKAVSSGAPLQTRLRDHHKSLIQAEDLDPRDFCVRVLPINDNWVAGCETRLITYFQPLWNTEVTGFGNHAPGSRRSTQRLSLWDTLHPGRTWAATMELDLPRHAVVSMVHRWCARRGMNPIRQWTPPDPTDVILWNPNPDP